MNNPRLLVIGVLILWSTGTLLGRLIADRAPFFLLGVSFLGSAAVFLPYYLLENRLQRDQDPIPFDWKIILSSICGYFIYSTCLCLSFRAYGRAAEPTVLNYTWPLFTVLFTRLYRPLDQRNNAHHPRLENLGLACGFLGVIFLAVDGNPFRSGVFQPAGLIWGIAAGISYGYYSARSGLIPARRHAAFLLLGSLLSVLCILPLGYGDLAEVSVLKQTDWACALALGILVNGLGYGLWTRANRLAREQQIPAAQLAAPTFFLPIFALLLVYLVLGEGRVFSPVVVVSALLVLAGSLICRRPDLFTSHYWRFGTMTRIVDKRR